MKLMSACLFKQSCPITDEQLYNWTGTPLITSSYLEKNRFLPQQIDSTPPTSTWAWDGQPPILTRSGKVTLMLANHVQVWPKTIKPIGYYKVNTSHVQSKHTVQSEINRVTASRSHCYFCRKTNYKTVCIGSPKIWMKSHKYALPAV